MINASFSALNHTEGLMSVELGIKSKTSQAITFENKAGIMLDCPGNRSNPFDMQIAEPLFQFCLSLLIPVVIDTSHWNCCLCSMANVLHLMGDIDCEDVFRMIIGTHLSWFHQKLLENNSRWFCKNANLFQNMQAVLFRCFGYSILSFRKSTFDELQVVVKECQLPMLLILTHTQSETQKHVLGVFPSIEGNETSHFIDGTYSKCITI